MKPYIVCHMMASLDGRIDCSMTEKLEGTDEYYHALDSLNTPTCLSGKVTMAMHNAMKGVFEPKEERPIGQTAFCKKTEAAGYTVSVDTRGTLLWPSNIVEGKPLVCVMSELASTEYTDYLESKNISWITVGKDCIDLCRAVDILNVEFSVERMAVVGGGNINGAFLDAGLLDEVSMMYAAGIDGRKGMTAAFDGLAPDREPFVLKLRNFRQFDCGTVWMRYDVG